MSGNNIEPKRRVCSVFQNVFNDFNEKCFVTDITQLGMCIT